MEACCFSKHQKVQPFVATISSLRMSLISQVVAVSNCRMVPGKGILCGNQKPVSLSHEFTSITIHWNECPLDPLGEGIQACSSVIIHHIQRQPQNLSYSLDTQAKAVLWKPSSSYRAGGLWEACGKPTTATSVQVQSRDLGNNSSR